MISNLILIQFLHQILQIEGMKYKIYTKRVTDTTILKTIPFSAEYQISLNFNFKNICFSVYAKCISKIYKL